MGKAHLNKTDGLEAIAGDIPSFWASNTSSKKYSKNYQFDFKNYFLTYETVPDLEIF